MLIRSIAIVILINIGNLILRKIHFFKSLNSFGGIYFEHIIVWSSLVPLSALTDAFMKVRGLQVVIDFFLLPLGVSRLNSSFFLKL